MDKQTIQLVAWESSLQKELQGLQERRQLVDNEIQRVSKKLELVRQMRLLEDSSEVSVSTIPSPSAEARPTPVVVRDGVKKILTESARPLHIGEIHSEFLKRGLPIPGSGTPFNILAHVVNDKAFVRVARGTYALAGSVPEDRVLPKAQPRTRKRRRRKRELLRDKED